MTILALIQEIPEYFQSVIFFGHNPTFTYIFNHFSKNRLDNLPTAGVFVVESTAKRWEEVSPKNAQITHLLYPKMA